MIFNSLAACYNAYITAYRILQRRDEQKMSTIDIQNEERAVSSSDVQVEAAIANYELIRKLKQQHEQRLAALEAQHQTNVPRSKEEILARQEEMQRYETALESIPRVDLTLAQALQAASKVNRYKVITVKDEDGRRRKFEGALLAEASTRWRAGREQTRWTEKALYMRKDGKFVIACGHFTLWQGEENKFGYEVFDRLDEIDDQDLLDELRSNLCKKFAANIPLFEIASPLEGV